MFKKILSFITAIGLAILANLSPCSLTNAVPVSSVNNFYFKDFSAAYYLWRDEDGTSRMRVVEELTAVFPSHGQNHGITRVIPFTNKNGQNLTMASDKTLWIDVERNGIEEPVNKVEIGDGYFEVYIGDADKYVTGEQTYTLIYDFENVITDYSHFEQGARAWQELYWDANGNDWSQRFEQVTARVYLDEAIANELDGQRACYVGSYGEKGEDRCKITEFTDEIDLGDGLKSMGGIEFSAKNLRSRETLTFVLGFNPSTFAIPPKHFDYRLVAATILALVSGAGLIFLMIKCYTATARKRHYYKGLFVKPEYTPLPDVTVAEMSENYIGKGQRGDSRVATLLDMAVHHKIEMVKSEKDALLGKKKKTRWIIRIKTDTMNIQQATVLKILAGDNTPLKVGQEITVKAHSATTTLTKLEEKFKESVTNNLVKKGFMLDSKKKDSTKKVRNWSNILVACDSIWFIAGIFAATFLFADIPSYITLLGEEVLPIIYIAILATIFIAGIIVVIKTSSFFTHTEKGLEASKYLEGLKMYMEMAEADRLKMLQSVKGADTTHTGIVKLYEKLLPYAVLFKLEESWLKELSHYYEFDDVSSPAWYIGIGAFSAHDFSTAMLAASSSMSSSISYSTTSNSSSGGSGFSGGGGFAGGGGGGGGGGGW